MARPPDAPPDETELGEFFDLSIDPMSIIGLDGKFKRVNASFVRLLGYSRSELFSRTALDLAHPDDVERTREALAQLAEGHDQVGLEARLLCADGTVRWLEWNTRSMPEQGVVYTVGRDTTGRRRVEAELHEAQRSLEASRDALRVLAEEKAALRRVATLVARDVPPDELFGAVACEVGVLLGADLGETIQYEGDGTVTAVATWAAVGEHPPVPERWQIEPGELMWLILESRAATRVEDWASVPGQFAEAVRNGFGVSSSVGCPIVVEGRLWGALAVHSEQRRRLPPDTESRIAQFTDLVGTAIANAESRGRADRLAEEQAALRRLATLVAREAPLEDVFAKVAKEVADVLGAVECGLLRDEGDGTARIVAISDASAAQIGERLSLEDDSVTALVLRDGQAARIDDYSAAAGDVADGAQERGIRSSIGCPIAVGNRTWGVMAVATRRAEPLPAEAEARIGQFTELVATAIANTEARAEVERLAEEQAALRRVATFVAEGVQPAALFSAVTQEIALLFADVSRSLLPSVIRFDPGPEFVLVGAARPMLDLPLDSRWGSKDLYVSTRVLRSGRSARVDEADVAELGGPDADLLRRQGFLHQVGSPIVVEDRLWGAMTINSGEPLPPDAGDRLEKFTELVATAIANAESREGLRRLADEQAFLRRVATLVARGLGPDPVFRAVVDAAQARFGADISAIVRFDADGKVTVMGAQGSPHEAGERVELDPGYVVDAVRKTGQAARFDSDDPADASMPDYVRELRIRSGLAGPIIVDGRLWGAITLASLDRPLPAGTARRLADFTELMATAVSNTQAREDLQRLVEEQAALRRVATLVAQAMPSEALFSAVCDEVEALAGADGSAVLRFDADGMGTVMGSHGGHHPVGTRVELAPDFVVGEVHRTGRPARFDTDDPATPDMPEVVRAARILSAVANPILVEGELWGAITTASRERPLAAAMERRLTDFTELVATAVSNLKARTEVAASRARIAAAADDERRRVVRDLHDGAQQRLVHTIVTLKLARQAIEDNGAAAESLVDEALEQAQQGNTALRELAHGILPSALTRGGLRAGVESVLERLDLPVDVDVSAARFPSEIEASGYFIVAEALTNVVKHARAERVEVRAAVRDGTLCIEVRDDGVGGADAHGPGLQGLADRAAARGGRLEVESPDAGGTRLTAVLPVSP